MSTEDMSLKSFTAQYSGGTASSFSEESQQQTTRRVNEFTLKAPRNIMDTIEVSSVRDRLKISDNAATTLMSSFIKACHGDVNDFHFTRRARIANRLQISREVMDKVTQNSPLHIALHWDGKLTTTRLSSKYEALAVIHLVRHLTRMENFLE